MISAEQLVGEELAEWYALTPMERWRESAKLWEIYRSLGGSFDAEPDTQSPFFDGETSCARPVDGWAGLYGTARRSMNNLNPKVDVYFTAGCGRCPLFATPQCKVNNWQEELEKLRTLILDCGLTEELKWGVPVYTFQKSNVVLISAFNENCALNFFKGALLKDAAGILKKPGENTQAARVIRFTDVREIIERETILKAYIYEAIEVEKAGLKVKFKETAEFIIPEELQNKLDEIPVLKTAFEALTQGRQRAYILYYSQPKQSKTRASRVEKCMPQILKRKGLND